MPFIWRSSSFAGGGTRSRPCPRISRRAFPTGRPAAGPTVCTARVTQRCAGIAGSVAVPVVVPVMVVVVSVTVMVVMMMVVVMAPPYHAAVVMAVAPVVVADPEPRDIVDHIGVLNSRLHRRRGDDRRTCVRRHQRGTRHGDRRGSQAQKQLAHLGTSPKARLRASSARSAHHVMSPTYAPYAPEAVALMSGAFSRGSTTRRHRGGAVREVCSRSIPPVFWQQPAFSDEACSGRFAAVSPWHGQTTDSPGPSRADRRDRAA
jgi:hypothetical protein